ncbi:GntR family transcriptional regulator [Demetria terragena]|uniref:GntR family transcriptional regulator n=1 Tax=Demetria terragena TaxID=63959 RepID=UPI00058DCE0B|nr:GntR family transcriptional regulator [Demetria terragena]
MTVRVPRYHVVMGQIADLIGESEAGTQVPTERELALRFETSRTTVRQALAALAADGRIARTQGSGTVVAEPNRVVVHQLTSYHDDLVAQGREPASTIIDVSRVAPDREVAAALGLSTMVYRVERVRHVDGEPLAHEVAYLRGPLPRLRQELERHHSLYVTLRQSYGVEFGRAEDVVESALASPQESALLGVDSGAPMLVVRRTAYGIDGTPVEFTRSAFRGDRFRFAAESSF